MSDITEKKRLYDIEYRSKNKERRADQNKVWYNKSRKVKFTENPRHYLWYVARARSRQYGVEFSITEEDIFIPEFCPILETRLTKGNGYLPNAMSLDRVDNNKGYIPGNVRVISRRANLMKSSLTIDILEKLIKYINNEI